MRTKTYLKSYLVMSVFLLVMVSTAAGRIIYVDHDVAGNNDGSSWANAYNYLQDGLAVAVADDEIRVADGTYKPDANSRSPDGTGDRQATFRLISGVALYGGYAGFGEPDPNARDINLYKTVLSGDLGAVDDKADNSLHVVTGSGTDTNSVLDGFTITAGNANGSAPHNRGGGIYNDGGSPTLADCTLVENRAENGGGIYNRDGSAPTLTNCTFSRNAANQTIPCGGAMFNYKSSPTLTGCVFSGNGAQSGGGAIYNQASSVTLVNCTFRRNWAHHVIGFGGAIVNKYRRPVVVSCTFAGNSAHSGGAVFNFKNTPTFTNCVFSGNWAKFGGGMENKESNIAAINCTFSGNFAFFGRGIFNMQRSDARISSSILWDGGSEVWSSDNSTTNVSHSCLQDAEPNDSNVYPGVGNIDEDPCFVKPGFWDANGVWVEGDYHLLPSSPCIDAGDNNSVHADTLDLDGDGNTTEPIPFDLDSNPRIVDGNYDGNAVVDMGAYEFFLPPMEVPMKFTPQALNPDSKGNWVKVHFVLPAGFTIEDVDTNTPAVIVPLGIEADYINVFSNEDGLVEIEAAFGRAAFCGAATVHVPVEVTVIGLLTSGQYFYGTDTIKIINKSFEYLGVLASHWLEADCGAPDWCGGGDLDHSSAVDLVDFALFDGCCIEVIRQ